MSGIENRVRVGRCSGGGVGRAARPRRAGSRTTFWQAGDTPAATSAFTLVELIVVMAIILVLAGLILAMSSYVRDKGARSRAEAEIAAMSAALENYKADKGVYPTAITVDPRTQGNPVNYQSASLTLYESLSGDSDANRQAESDKTTYIAFNPNQLSPTDQAANVLFIKDPFGNSYGYSTIYASDSSKGYNPTFDLWTTCGNIDTNNPPNQSQWIKNW